MIARFFICLTLSSTVFGISVIDSGRRFDEFSGENIFSEITENDIERNDGECSGLSPELIKEIQSHQPVVDQIVSAVVNGKYSGDTWNA